MARKDLLKALIDEQKTGAAKPQPKAEQAKDQPKINEALTRHSRGGVGAVSRSLNDLKTRSVIEIAPELIALDGAQDRIDANTQDDEILLESIREYGQ